MILISTVTKIDSKKLGTRKVIGRALTEEELKESYPACYRHSNKEYLGELKEIRGILDNANVYSFTLSKVLIIKNLGTSQVLEYEDHEDLFKRVFLYDYGVPQCEVLNV